MDEITLKVSVPDGLEFSALQFARDPDGHVSFDWEPIKAICAASGIDLRAFTESQEDNIASLIIGWYQAHIANGGTPDSIAEDLIAEAAIEDAYGGGFSMPPGRA